MNMNQVYLAPAQQLQVVMDVTKHKIVWLLDVHKDIQVAILILFATGNRPENT